jgi:thymidylate synthase
MNLQENTHPEYQYLHLLEDVLRNGTEKVDRGTNVKLYSIFGRQVRYDLSKGFPLLTTKRVYWKGVLHELYWFFSGQSNIKYLVENDVHIWDDYPYKIYKKTHPKEKLSKEEFIENVRTDSIFAKKHAELKRIYGEMWRRWPTKNNHTIDQLKWVMDELKEDPDAKNLIVTSWNPEYLYTMATYKNASRFPICHNMYQLNVQNDTLCLQLYQRSADLFLGVPFNIASYSLLLLVLSKIAGYKPGEFIHTFGDVHIYENHINQVKEQLKRTPRPFPKVIIDPSVKHIDDFRPEHIQLLHYDPYPALKGELTVAGGLYEKE